MGDHHHRRSSFREKSRQQHGDDPRRDEQQFDADRMARILGMLGSEHDGEVLAAARHAEAMRARAGLTWAQIIGSRPAISSEIDITRGGMHPDDVRWIIKFCLSHLHIMSAWETDFLLNLDSRNRVPSEKQMVILNKCYIKADAESARRARARREAAE